MRLNLVAGSLVALLTTSAYAATVDDMKLKPAKYTYEAATDIVAAQVCLKKTYDGFTLDSITNDDHTVDVDVTMMGNRLALITLSPDDTGTKVDGRGRQAGIVENPKFRTCLGLPAKA